MSNSRYTRANSRHNHGIDLAADRRPRTLPVSQESQEGQDNAYLRGRTGISPVKQRYHVRDEQSALQEEEGNTHSVTGGARGGRGLGHTGKRIPKRETCCNNSGKRGEARDGVGGACDQRDQVSGERCRQEAQLAKSARTKPHATAGAY